MAQQADKDLVTIVTDVPLDITVDDLGPARVARPARLPGSSARFGDGCTAKRTRKGVWCGGGDSNPHPQ